MGRKSCLNGWKIRGCSDALKNWLHSVHASSRFGPEPSPHHRPPSPSMLLGNLRSYVSPEQYPAYVGSDPFDDSNLQAADRGAEVVVAPLGGRESGSLPPTIGNRRSRTLATPAGRSPPAVGTWHVGDRTAVRSQPRRYLVGLRGGVVQPITRPVIGWSMLIAESRCVWRGTDTGSPALHPAHACGLGASSARSTGERLAGCNERSTSRIHSEDGVC